MSQFVVGLGEVLWDVFPKGKRLGGAPANFAYHAAQFGHEGLVVSAIGLDKLGSAIISELDKHALPYHLDRVPYPTGTVDVDLSDPNAPFYTINTKVAWSHIPFTESISARNTTQKPPSVKASAGAFIGSYLNGASIPQAHALAVQVSAYVCTQKGAMPVIPEDLIH